MVLLSTAIHQQLTSILGSDQLLPLSETALSSIRKTEQICQHGNLPADMVCPRTQAELAAVMAMANQQQWRVLICGQGSKLQWGGFTDRIDLVVSTRLLNRVVAHATGDLTVTVEAGLSLATLQKQLCQFQQFVALDPAYPQTATIGGLLATRDSGSLRHRYGSLRDMCLGITFVRADGQLATAGGRVVKNVAGYDLMKLLTGSYGTLGVISEVTLRLYPLPEAASTILISGSAQEITALNRSLLNSTLTPTAVDVFSASALSAWSVQREMGLAVRVQSLDESVAEHCDRILHQAPHLSTLTLDVAPEADFWHQITAQFWSASASEAVVCKFGVLPAQATQFLSEVMAYCQQQTVSCKGQIHAGSGTGILRLEDERLGDPEVAGVWIQALRSHCQSAQGYLTVLEAPSALKQAIDIWGYTGNTLTLMTKLKHQFDPKNILNPDRFVGGI